MDQGKGGGVFEKRGNRPLRSAGDKRGYFVDSAFHLTHDAGFFSMCSTALFELCREKRMTTAIYAKESFSHFGKDFGENPWDFYFRQPRQEISATYSDKNPFGRRLRHHSDYSTLPLKRVRGHISRYFSPADEVKRREANLLAKYDIDPSRTITVCYRGTDKGTELALEDPEVYLDASRALLKRRPRSRVLVQTDQAQVRDFLVSSLGERAFYIDEMPVTETETAIHQIITPEQQVSFGQTLLATVLVMASTKHLITHTGNMALWTVLYREHTKRVLQLGIERRD